LSKKRITIKSKVLSLPSVKQNKTKQNKKMKKLISKGSANAKTSKNAIETHILYLMPSNRNSKGINLCPDSSEGCIDVCLVDAGLASVYTSVNIARGLRTEMYLQERQKFCEQILKELDLLNKKAIKKDGIIEVRLNGTSDLDFIGIIKNRCGFDILSFSNLSFSTAFSFFLPFSFTFSFPIDLEKLKSISDSFSSSFNFSPSFPFSFFTFSFF
jgi:hypothetical protein